MRGPFGVFGGGEMGKLIAVASGKGGVGKTTVAGGIAGALASMGRSVLLVDGDAAMGNLDLVLGLEGAATSDLVDVLHGICPLRKAILRISREDPLWFLPVALPGKTDLSVLAALPQVLSLLAGRFDYVIADCPAGIGEIAGHLLCGAELTLMVTTPEKMALRDARRVLSTLDRPSGQRRLIVNRIRPQLIRQGTAPDVDAMIDMMGLQLIGLLEEDPSVTPLQNAGVPIIFHTACPAGRQLWDIARRVDGQQTPLRI